MTCKAPACLLRSCIRLATLLLVIAAIAPLCTAADLNSDTLQPPPAGPVSPATGCGGDAGDGRPGTDASGYCTQPGAIGIKVTINPLSTVPLPTTTSPPRGINIPTTTPAPAVTIRFNHTLVTVPPVTTTTPPVTTLTIKPVTPSLALNRSPAVAAATTTPCRACNTTSAPSKNLSMAQVAPTTAAFLGQQKNQPGIVESLLGLFGSFGSLLGKPKQEVQVGTWSTIYQNATQYVSVNGRLSAKNNESLFIEMESDPGFNNVYGNNGVGTYTWAPPLNDNGQVASAVWQVSLMQFPHDRRFWSSPPGMLGMGTMSGSQREFTVNFNDYIPKPEIVADRWVDKQPILEFKKTQLSQLEAQLAVQQPFDPGAPQQSEVNQVVLDQLEAAENIVDLKLATIQPYHYQGSALRALPPPDTMSPSMVNPAMEKIRADTMKEALTLSLPSDRRTVYIRVALFDSNGNCTGFTNQLPVTVGKKTITLVGPWSGWQDIAGSASPVTADQVAGPVATYFNGKIYLFGHTQPGNRLMMATVDNANTFSGWSEVAGAPITATPVSAAVLSTHEQYSPKYLYVVSKGSDQQGDMHLYISRMNPQGGWSTWTIMPYSMLTEHAPSLSGWTNSYDHGLIMTAREWGSNKNFYTTLTFPRGDPTEMTSPQWAPWKQITGSPDTIDAPAAVMFSYTRAGIPPYSSSYYGIFFVARSASTANGFTAGRLYYSSYDNYTYFEGQRPANSPDVPADEKSYTATNTWSGWSEIPGNQNFIMAPSVAVISDRLYVVDKMNQVTYTYLDSQGQWASWAVLPQVHPSPNPVLVTGESVPAMIVAGEDAAGRPLFINMQRDPLLILTGQENRGSGPMNYWTMCDLSGEFTRCHFYWKNSDTYFTRLWDEWIWTGLATSRTDGKRVVWQFSRVPFNDTAIPDREFTYSELDRSTPGIIASGILPAPATMVISSSPADVPAVRAFPITIKYFFKDINSTVPFYVRGILLTPGDKPGEMKGFVTPSRTFVYSPAPEIHSCPKPDIVDQVVQVPDVTIEKYQAVEYPAVDASCHVISSNGPIEGPFGDICPAKNSKKSVCSDDKGILDYITEFFGDLINLIEALVNFMSRMWDSIKSYCVEIVATSLGCPECKEVISGCIDVGLASIGVPPSLPNFADLQNMGADYLTATIADGVGLPPQAVAPAVGMMNSAIEDSASSGSSDLCGWRLDPDFQGHPEYLVVKLKNKHYINTTPGILYVRDTFTDSRGTTQSVFRSAQAGIPYPKLTPGQEVTIPIFLERTVTPQTIGGCQRKVNGQWKEWTCDDFAGNLNFDDWDLGYGQTHPMKVWLSPSSSIDIAALEQELGKTCKGTTDGSTSSSPLFTYGTCPQGEFYIHYVYAGKETDTITFDPRQDWNR